MPNLLLFGCLAVAAVAMSAAALFAMRPGDLARQLVKERGFRYLRDNRVVEREIDGIAVTVEIGHTWTTLTARGNLETNVSLGPAASGTIATLDPGFDRRVGVSGDPLLARALLTLETRSRIVRMGARLESGTLTRIAALAARAELDDKIDSLVELAKALDHSQPPAALLAESVRSDPFLAIRRACFATLLEHFPDDAATLQLLSAIGDTSDVEIRSRAALHRGALDAPALAQFICTPDLPVELRGKAANVLARLDRIAFEAVAHRVFSTDCEIALAAGFLDAGAVPPVDALVSIASRAGATASDKIELIHALSRSSHTAGDAVFFALLDDASEDVAVAAADAVGARGDVESIPLLHVRESAVSSSRVREAVVRAIAAIHARASGGAGDLALAGSEGGSLSISSLAGAVGIGGKKS